MTKTLKPAENSKTKMTTLKHHQNVDYTAIEDRWSIEVTIAILPVWLSRFACIQPSSIP